MLKRVFVLLLINLSCLLYAQQITRFAVVDLPKVYTAFFRESREVRQFEANSARVQSEIDKITKEIQDMKSKQVDAALKGDQTESLRLENQIYRRSEFLKEYYNTKTAELEDQKSKLLRSGSFLSQIYDEIRYLAEAEGCTMVFNLKETPGIVWYSSTVDITDKLISNLLNRSRN